MLSAGVLLLASIVLLDGKSGKVLLQEGNVRVTSAPGSTLKPFVLGALQRRGLADGRMVCDGHLREGGHNLDCAHGKVATPMDGTAAVAYSCNRWFAEHARRLAPADLKRELEAAGLGPVTLARSSDEVVLQALGEYGVKVSPQTLARSYRRLLLTRPAGVMEGLRAAVEYGTARRAGLEGVKVWGKTGTTSAHEAWFAGFTGDRVVAVRLPGGSGGADAAPVGAAKLRRRGTGPEPLLVRVESGVVMMSLEEMTRRVLESEAGHVKSPESLQAMAITTRTFITVNRGRHRKDGYDFCSTTHCQLVRAVKPVAAVARAVEETEGELLWYNGRPAMVYYHRHCGGTTEAAEELWPRSARPYLRSVQDSFCLTNGTASWQAEVSAPDLQKALGLKFLNHFAVMGRTESGRVATVEAGGQLLRGDAIHTALGRAVGWQALKSTYYTVTRTPRGFLFAGRGSGHGVGMCQTGAALRGDAGQSYRQILDAYFPGTLVGITPQGLTWERRTGERVEVLSLDNGRDDGLVVLADRALAAAEQRLGFPVSGKPRVRVYPSVAMFRDATGEPGWVAGVTRGSTVSLQPVSVLREREALESTVLHEMIHVVLNSRIERDLPAWFEEGLALHFGGTGGTTREGYVEAKQRVEKLLAKYGQGTVLGWLRTGLPAEVRR